MSDLTPEMRVLRRRQGDKIASVLRKVIGPRPVPVDIDPYVEELAEIYRASSASTQATIEYFLMSSLQGCIEDLIRLATSMEKSALGPARDEVA